MSQFIFDQEPETKVEKHDDRVFTLTTAMKYVVDDYDEYLGSDELSHHERLDYFELQDYTRKEDNPEVLDLRWMDDEDVVQIVNNGLNQEIKTVLMNINNLVCSYFSKYEGFDDLEVVICDKDVKLNPVQKVKIIKSFLNSNIDVISNIKFVGFSNVMTSILDKYAEKYISSKSNDLDKGSIRK